MRLGITGSRKFKDLTLVTKMLNLIRQNLPQSEDLIIVSGAKIDDKINGKNLVDATALQWANDNEEPFMMLPPKWKRDGKGAGMIRNPKIVDNGDDGTLSFHDGKSKGTKATIEYAKSKGKYLGNVSENGDIELTDYGKEVFPWMR